NVDDARTWRHPRRKALRQQERRGNIYTDSLLPFDRRDLGERFHHRNACVVHEQVDWVTADFGDEIGNATRRREIVNQWRHLRTLRLDNFARLCQRHRVASVQKQFHIFSSELFGNGATDRAAGACDEISFHALPSMSNAQPASARLRRGRRATSNAESQNPVLAGLSPAKSY